MGKVFRKGPVRTDITGTVEKKRGGSSRITIRKMIHAERKELTESNCVEKSSPVNIL